MFRSAWLAQITKAFRGQHYRRVAAACDEGLFKPTPIQANGVGELFGKLFNLATS
jgi:hypothetical protein